MNTNYESARWALAICMQSCTGLDVFPLELLLPADDNAVLCTPEHLTAAMGLAGLDATLVESTAVGALVHDALKNKWLAVCCVGLHPQQDRQRWLVAVGREGRTVDFLGAGLGEPLFSPEPAHFRPLVIVVRGRQGMVHGPWPELT